MTCMRVKLVDERTHEADLHLILFEARTNFRESFAKESVFGSERTGFARTHPTERWNHELILRVKMNAERLLELRPE